MMSAYRPVLLAIGAALCGAALFQALGVPAGPLVGSTVAVTALAATGLSPRVPPTLRNLGFTAIGVTLGAGVTTHFLTDVLRFPASLVALTLTMVAVMLISSNVLKRFFGVAGGTAVLATSPGALSYSLSLAADRPAAKIDIPFVMVLQSLRLLIITIALPPLVALVERGAGGGGAVIVLHTLGIPASLVLIAIAALGGYLFERLRIPAAFLLAGVAISGIGHGVGWLEGRPSPILTFIGFSLAGAVIGARFASVTRTQLRDLLLAGLVVTTIAVVFSGLASFVVAEFLALPFGQVWVSFAPGGVEGMSAMALSLGYDPAYVATHHIFRLLLLIAILPMFMRAPRSDEL
ncbi:AbrB family transcriptional regulator [Jiella avicenniae]|uniref:AbrB family transcriptional regulator n=1 Tax=Jiella avicenniae TaxID=2907202 RepID=A0A9X1T4C0_9HYPH|nr:AbrB family transcriptional regulator [Jiella avicenniae]MCE7027747.1 AbrB family transcriptional regulator [Jiella avicenniae]MCE7028789.1 AbrB family transcriptional regulator [Jiella avicenniae]